MLELPDALAWTPDALERLPSGYRYEVHEGNLLIMAAAMPPWHADVQRRVVQLLVGQGKHAYLEQGVILSGSEIRTCDVGVFPKPPIGTVAYHPASEFSLLVEIASVGSRREDRDVKPKLYGGAGVPEYWRVEEGADGEPIVYQYRLVRLTDGTTIYAEYRVVALTALEGDRLEP